jgi:hypothetical protein
METDREAFTKIAEALKHQAERLIDFQFDLFALAEARRLIVICFYPAQRAA